jgi:hypothetical protein
VSGGAIRCSFFFKNFDGFLKGFDNPVLTVIIYQCAAILAPENGIRSHAPDSSASLCRKIVSLSRRASEMDADIAGWRIGARPRSGKSSAAFL